jgi:hypothetical protein
MSPKSSGSFNSGDYALVAERITLFYSRHPSGRIITELVSRSEYGKAREVTFKALVFREANDSLPAATGWASEREGDGDINTVACLENTETSAVGRALANLGFTASARRPSREEMEKAARARARLHLVSVSAPQDEEERDPVAENVTRSLLYLLHQAEMCGMRAARAQRYRRILEHSPPRGPVLRHLERRLWNWLHREPGAHDVSGR